VTTYRKSDTEATDTILLLDTSISKRYIDFFPEHHSAQPAFTFSAAVSYVLLASTSAESEHHRGMLNLENKNTRCLRNNHRYCYGNQTSTRSRYVYETQYRFCLLAWSSGKARVTSSTRRSGEARSPGSANSAYPSWSSPLARKSSWSRESWSTRRTWKAGNSSRSCTQTEHRQNNTRIAARRPRAYLGRGQTPMPPQWPHIMVLRMALLHNGQTLIDRTHFTPSYSTLLSSTFGNSVAVQRFNAVLSHTWVFCRTRRRAEPLAIPTCVLAFVFSPLAFYTIGQKIIKIQRFNAILLHNSFSSDEYWPLQLFVLLLTLF